MRLRISEGELDFYATAKRDNRPVYVQGRNWRVVGVTADMVGGSVQHGLGDPRSPARVNPAPRRIAQWWVELSELG
jgi:hypothetical protein